MKVFLHEQKDLLCLFVPNVLLTALLCYLYNVPWDMSLILGIFLLSLYMIWMCLRWYNYRDRQKALESRALESVCYTPEQQEMKHVYEELMEEDRKEIERQWQIAIDTQEYFAFWAHEVKLPIAAIYLLLQNEEVPKAQIKEQVHRIEQYTTQAMGYVKSVFDENDFHLARIELKPLVQKVIRSFAAECIGRHISIELDGQGQMVLTDEKWAHFILEQVLSNAIKYSNENSTIEIVLNRNTVAIKDHGCGIAPQDLEAVFACGITGSSQYDPNRSSGIGLYLTRRICNLLGHEIDLSSAEGEGTEVIIRFEEARILNKDLS